MASRTATFLAPHAFPKQALGLPYEEYETHQARKRISDCYESLSSSSSISSFRSHATGSSGHSRNNSLSPTSSNGSQSSEERLIKSKVRHATRAALEPAFVPETDGYGNSKRKLRREAEYYDDDGEPPVPQHIIDEFNRLWLEDDDEGHSEREPIRPNLKGEQRNHASVVRCEAEVSSMLSHVDQYERSHGAERHRLPKYQEDSDRRPVRMMAQVMMPAYSHFDWESSDYDSEADAEPRKRNVLRKKSSKK